MKSKSHMKFRALVLSTLILNGCITVPVTSTEQNKICQLSSDKKTLKVIDVAKETNTFYNVSGIILLPILVPTSAIISGTFVLINNIYHYGEGKIVCETPKPTFHERS